MAFVHDGLEATRLDKVRYLVQSPMLVENLRVCAADQLSDVYNCGRCEKCMRTSLCLYAAGALEMCKTLPHSIDVELLRAMPISGLKKGRPKSIYEVVLDVLRNTGADSTLQAALEECITRNLA